MIITVGNKRADLNGLYIFVSFAISTEIYAMQVQFFRLYHKDSSRSLTNEFAGLFQITDCEWQNVQNLFSHNFHLSPQRCPVKPCCQHHFFCMCCNMLDMTLIGMIAIRVRMLHDVILPDNHDRRMRMKKKIIRFTPISSKSIKFCYHRSNFAPFQNKNNRNEGVYSFTWISFDAICWKHVFYRFDWLRRNIFIFNFVATFLQVWFSWVWMQLTKPQPLLILWMWQRRFFGVLVVCRF